MVPIHLVGRSNVTKTDWCESTWAREAIFLKKQGSDNRMSLKMLALFATFPDGFTLGEEFESLLDQVDLRS